MTLDSYDKQRLKSQCGVIAHPESEDQDCRFLSWWQVCRIKRQPMYHGHLVWEEDYTSECCLPWLQLDLWKADASIYNHDLVNRDYLLPPLPTSAPWAQVLDQLWVAEQTTWLLLWVMPIVPTKYPCQYTGLWWPYLFLPHEVLQEMYIKSHPTIDQHFQFYLHTVQWSISWTPLLQAHPNHPNFHIV